MRLIFADPRQEIWSKETGVFAYPARKQFHPGVPELFHKYMVETVVGGQTIATLELTPEQTADLRDKLSGLEDIKELVCKCRKEMICPIHGDW